MMSYSFFDLAKEVLERENIPRSAEYMWISKIMRIPVLHR